MKLCRLCQVLLTRECSIYRFDGTWKYAEAEELKREVHSVHPSNVTNEEPMQVRFAKGISIIECFRTITLRVSSRIVERS